MLPMIPKSFLRFLDGSYDSYELPLRFLWASYDSFASYELPIGFL